MKKLVKPAKQAENKVSLFGTTATAEACCPVTCS